MAIKKMAVLTSGGDSPGMNAAIRAVVRVGMTLGAEVVGVRRGFAGLIAGEFLPMDARLVGGIIQRGGTVLGTVRAPEFLDVDVQKKAIENMRDCGVEGLVVIGGNGSLAGALALHELGFSTIGIPATIDNDVSGTDLAIGVDTAINTALEAVDRIKDTASSHNRAFIIEVMGRNSGYLALMTGMAAGAEMVIVPEVRVSFEDILDELRQAYARGKPHFIVIVAEGATPRASTLSDYIKQSCARGGETFESRLTVLGHVQRGGSPSANDRILATQLGSSAAEVLSQGGSGLMVGIHCGRVITSEISTILKQRKPLPKELYDLSHLLST
ncbi:MAG: 6-phosphofructokinase [Chloroflexota bacterium]